MRLLHVLAETGYSGGEAQLRSILAGLAQRGHENQIVLAPGAAFGPEGEGYFRWCFASSEERLADGVRRLAASLR